MIVTYSNAWFAGHIVLLFLILGTLALLIHFLPSFIAFSRGHPYRLLILLLNFMFGWTGIGWVVLLVWALMESDTNVRKPIVVADTASHSLTKSY